MRDIVPDMMGELEGWRVFTLTSDSLYSYSKGFRWEPGPNQALCIGYEHTVSAIRNRPDGSGVEHVEIIAHDRIPSPSCQCGFWAYPTPTALKKKERAFGKLPRPGKPRNPRNSLGGHFGAFGSDSAVDLIIGRIAAWGRVLEGTDGFRSEWARVSGLIGSSDDKKLVEVAKLYAVEVIPWSDINLFEEKQEAFTEIEVTKVGPLEKAADGYRYRPIEIYTDTQVYKVWPNSKPGRFLRVAAPRSHWKITYEENEFMGRKDKMIVEAVPVSPDPSDTDYAE